jgi:hypothetical protein
MWFEFAARPNPEWPGTRGLRVIRNKLANGYRVMQNSPGPDIFARL